MSASLANEPLEIRAIGLPLERIEGRAKVTGTAPYAYEHALADPLYLHPVQATIAYGRITAIDTGAAKALHGVVAVITHENAPRLASGDNKELWVLQSDEVGFRGQFIGAVIAESPEIALHAAGLVRVQYAEYPHQAGLRADRDDLYAPKQVNPDYPTDTEEGDPDAGLKTAAVTIDHVYSTPMEFNNPMEPHTTVAVWVDDGFTLYDSTQGAHSVRTTLASLFGLDPGKIHVIAPHVGGGFGSKGEPHAHDALACLAARAVPGRPVKFTLTRQHMFAVAGHRTPTIQRIRLGADRDGRLTAIVHDVIEQTARIKEFAEQTAVPTRMMYAAPGRRTTHRLAALDVPVPSWMRAPGETPGMFAGEVAMDELAVACGIDPIELRIRNEPATDPESGKPWSGRNLIGCLREGARRFGWDGRDPRPRMRRQDGWLIGMGVASSTYPRYALPGSVATIRLGADRRYAVRIGAADIGTGTWTALTQIAADALRCPIEATAGDRRHGAPRRLGRGWLERHQLLGIDHRCRGSCVPCPAWRRSGRGRGDIGGDAGESRRKALRDALLRRAVRRGAGERGHRRSPSHTDARRVLGGADHQSAHGAITVHRRNDDGPVDGAAGGWRAGCAIWPCGDTRFCRIPHRGECRCRRYGRDLAG
jgi:xanthine dehydrogenase YagR molybdenum-binding subunit